MEELIKYAEQNGSQSAPLLKDLLLKLNELISQERIIINPLIYPKLANSQPVTEEELSECGITVDRLEKWLEDIKFPSVRVQPDFSGDYSEGGGGFVLSHTEAYTLTIKLPINPSADSYLILSVVTRPNLSIVSVSISE